MPVIEVVGPSGAGKSTAVRLCAAQDAQVRVLGLPAPGTYARSLPALVPTLLRLHQPFHRVLRREMKRVLHLAALRRTVEETRRLPDAVVLMDEGPIYMLGRLLFLADRALDTDAFRVWWGAAVDDWAGALDTIIWLDAATPVLINRIRGRAGTPPIADTGDAALTAFLARYRTCYARVLSRLEGPGGPAIVRIDTTTCTQPELADLVRDVVTEVRG